MSTHVKITIEAGIITKWTEFIRLVVESDDDKTIQEHCERAIYERFKIRISQRNGAWRWEREKLGPQPAFTYDDLLAAFEN